MSLQAANYFIFLPSLPGSSSVLLHLSFTAFKNKFCEAVQLRIYLQPSGFLLKQYFMRRDIFQAIADPTRRAILVLIAVHAMTPNAIAAHFDITRQSISKHLRILSECDLLAQKQEGREIYYGLKLDRMNEVDAWLDQFRKLMEQQFNQLDELLITLKNNDNEPI